MATVLVRGSSPEDVQAAAEEVGSALATKPSVARVATRVRARIVRSTRHSRGPTPVPTARDRLAAALTPEGMKKRLEETRTMLLAPGAGAAEEWLARDPLRLAQIPWEARGELAAGLIPSDDGSFVADGGKAQARRRAAAGERVQLDRRERVRSRRRRRHRGSEARSPRRATSSCAAGTPSPSRRKR